VKYWEFVFSGSAEDIHGIGLRESIRGIAIGVAKGILGEVRNNKKDGTVSVICQAEYAVAEEFLKNILAGEKKIDKHTKTQVDYPDEKASKFNSFTVKREDELSEMVWALQGAGKVFSSVEEKRKLALDNSLRLGLTVISACADELKSAPASKREFVLLAVDNYIQQCPTSDEGLVMGLYDLHELCAKANMLSSSTLPDDIVKKPDILKRISDICSEIDKKLAGKQ